MQQEDAVADAGKILFDQEAFHHGLVDQRLFQQQMQRRNIPAALVQREELLAGRVVGIDLEGLVEGIAGDQDGQPVVQNKQRLAHRLHDDLRKRANIFDLVEDRRRHCLFSRERATLGLLRRNSKDASAPWNFK